MARTVPFDAARHLKTRASQAELGVARALGVTLTARPVALAKRAIRRVAA
jgi:hypothetical protein